MKKLNIFLFSLSMAIVPYMAQAQSQTYKLFKVDLGVGYGFGKAKGVIGYLEPKFNILDKVAVGLRLEGAVLGNMSVAADNSTSGSSASANVEISAISSYALTGDYYLTNNKFRPFAGLGLGLYNMGSIKQSVDANSNGETSVEQSIHVGRKFGFAPRIGFEAGHFRMGLEYNLITNQPQEFNRNYFALKLGTVIGGGKK